MEKIKAIIFGVSGVLQLGKKKPRGYHEEVAKEVGVSIDQYLDSIDTAYAKSIEGKISEKRVLKEMSKNLKTTPSKLKRLYDEAYKKHLTLNRELLRYANKKKKQGIKTAILSDQWWLSKKALFPKDFYEFDAVVVSCDVGIRKPNPKIYLLTLKRLKVKPKESVFVDNQQWNLKPAKKLGMKTILFKNNRQTINQIEKLLR